ncbi:protein arginine N-methyltransferase [Caulobacter sp. NIBR2454]|uniref:protein arginine N-methyltransferase n=1 Tax=Caulobacter sp. NIBR2454 TaxID=3015996 RepID=UPI0022B66B7E|nr:protein arginine N-methyltransferase [Caulobacter sp. NIBR2454]
MTMQQGAARAPSAYVQPNQKAAQINVMIDSDFRASAGDYLIKSLDWAVLDPHGLAGAVDPELLDFLIHTARNHRFGRFISMRDLAHAVRRTQGDDPASLSWSYEGIAAAELGDAQRAFQCLMTAAAVTPQLPAHHYNCAILVIRSNGDYEAAAACFERALACDPGHTPSWGGLAVAALKLGENERAINAARKALEHGGEGRALNHLCLAAAQERLGRDFDFPAAPNPAPMAIPPLELEPPSIVLTVALDDAGVEQALRLATSVAQSAAGWAVHVLACNPSPWARQSLEAASAQGAWFSWSAELMVGSTPSELRTLAARITLSRLRDLARTPDVSVVLARSSMVFHTDPGVILPSTAQGAAALIGEGLLWDQVASHVMALRGGAAAVRFVDAALAAMDGPWRTTPLALGVGLWRACRGQEIRALTPADLRIVTEAPPITQAAPARGDINELVASRYGQMVLNRHDLYVTPGVRETGAWSQDELDLLAQLIKPGQTVLDVGANMGSHTLAFCNFVGPSGQVHAFEPQRVMFQAMVAGVALNSWTNAWCYMAAVGAKRGHIEVPDVAYDEPSNFGIMSLVPGWEGADNLRLAARTQTVEVLTIDGLGLSRCDLIKIDVEGMERDVLAGAAATLKAHRPILYMECQEGPRGAECLAYLKQFGYRAWWHGHAGSQNVVAFPQESAPATLGLQEA